MSNGITGLEQMDALMQKLEQMGKSIDDQLMDKAVKAGAEVAKEKIETHPNMPVSKENKKHARDHIELVKVTDGQYDIGVLNTYFYLLFHEIGAKGGLYKGEDDQIYVTPDINAKPFMRPAFESNKDEIESAMAGVIKRELGI